MPKRDLIIFDLDGTLVASHLDLVPALNAATASVNLPPVPIEAVGHIVGQGARAMLERAFTFHGRASETAQVDELFDLFLQHYEVHIADETVFFPNCLAALDTLAADGFTFAICTNKNEGLAEKLMAELGERDRFAVLTGGDTFTVKKPDPAHLAFTAERAQGTIERCIMVGDSINDIAAACAAPMPSIALPFGYSDRPVEELGADEIVADFGALPAAIHRLAAA